MNPNKESTTTELVHPDKQGVRTVDNSEVSFYQKKGWGLRKDVKPGGAELTPEISEAEQAERDAKLEEHRNAEREANADAEAARARAEIAAGAQGGADPNAGSGDGSGEAGDDPSTVDAPSAADGASVADDAPQGATDQPTG